jgi:hypothetical protein
MITRKLYLQLRDRPAPEASARLEREGWTGLPGLLSPSETAALRAEVERVYDTVAADVRNPGLAPDQREDFRYEMLNRSAACRRLVADRRLLDVIEPLLGEDCHVIANTCWRNPPREQNQHGGGFWHIDAGPHIPRDPDIPWDDRIPYPIFAIGAHLYLRDCPMESGPTGVIPGSHKSGMPPPMDRYDDITLTWNDVGVKPLVAKAGDVCLFVSDVWHRRMPSQPGDRGRYFLQAHYGRRDIAQRVRTTAAVNHVSPEAADRATTDRERSLIGLHRPWFYDG